MSYEQNLEPIGTNYDDSLPFTFIYVNNGDCGIYPVRVTTVEVLSVVLHSSIPFSPSTTTEHFDLTLSDVVDLSMEEG